MALGGGNDGVITVCGGTDPVGTVPLHPGGPPSNFMLEKTKGCPNGSGLTNVQSFKCTKSNEPFPDAKAVKSEKG